MDFEKAPHETTALSMRDGVVDAQEADREVPLVELPKGRWDRSWPVIACGAGLFSDGTATISNIYLMLKTTI
jgi:hypothetical protein